MDRVRKLEKEAMEARERFTSNIRSTMSRYSVTVPSPSKTVIKKREIRSPGVLGIGKRSKASEETETSTMLVPIRRVTPQKLKPLAPFIVGSITGSQPPLLLGEESWKKLLQVFAIFVYVNRSQTLDTVLSLLHQRQRDQVVLHYPSGRKSSIIKEDTHQQICKAIARGGNTETVIVDILRKSSPLELVRGSQKIVQEECKAICKRGSGSLLQKKSNADFFSFRWENLHKQLETMCPALLSIITATVSDIPPVIGSKPFLHALQTVGIALHGRSQEMTVLQYMNGFLLNHGGCTQRDIERLSHIGLTVHPLTLKRKLCDWQKILDKEILEIRDSWVEGGNVKYQIIGDNWDKNILPSYRTSDRKTLSLHLFHVYAILDRVIPTEHSSHSPPSHEIEISTFLPSIEDQQKLMKELTFLFSTSVIENHPHLQKEYGKIYPKHLEHKYSYCAGNKTKQYPLGLFDCNENKTPELIRLLKTLSTYVPCRDGEVVEPVFFGGDRLTDERVQAAQKAMNNAETQLQRLQGFVSKIEDFHRLMNFLEAIHKLTYSTYSAMDRGTVYYYRNFLNMRNVKGHVYNAYRAYKMLYYVILDAICLLLFLHHMGVSDIDQEIDLPSNFAVLSNREKIEYIDSVSENILRKHFFDNTNDIFQNVRDIVCDPQHPENYWTSTREEGRFKCHHCDKTYAHVVSLQTHEQKIHDVHIAKPSKKPKNKNQDQMQDYLMMLFKLVILHKNLDTSVDMGDGERAVRSAKYELPVYHLTNKVKYAIGSIHLTSLTSGILCDNQKERLIANRFVNLQGGKNNNVSLDEYLEMLNRDSKIACSGHKTKESILAHSKEYPHLINLVGHFDSITEIRKRKGFHHIPSYKGDVLKVFKDLQEANVMTLIPKRTFKCQGFTVDRNPFQNSFVGLSTVIHRHKPRQPFIRLRDPHV
ncbi:uncharacterized protein LOC125651350 [Ostrea edulis]|uniref:uncharacterized protein LOC125651350 n=1 Tax=Ostrea edulis TaxID=37623 RepID=UPI0024AF3002|nr:uncharacterized protein LOC125651350 [Ostrea edulis]